MRFKPFTEEETKPKKADFKKLLSPGPADFEISKAEDTLSKNNVEMLKLTLRVTDCNGDQGLVWDYITANAQWKLRGLLTAIGRESVYATGNCDAEEVSGGIGKCELKITKSEGYGEQAVVAFYSVPPSQIYSVPPSQIVAQNAESKPTAPELPPFDASEDVPF